jgi:glycosyltransferase involved in cell wall biosynthesis
VYPSLFEGFGFPVIEPLVVGTPVVCGTVGVVRELPSDAVLTVDQTSAGDIARGVREAVEGWCPPSSAVAWARQRFTWSRCATETADIYRSLL